MFSLEEIQKFLSFPDQILPLPPEFLTLSVATFAVRDPSTPKYTRLKTLSFIHLLLY
jgi:hypothetical protein